MKIRFSRNFEGWFDGKPSLGVTISAGRIYVIFMLVPMIGFNLMGEYTTGRGSYVETAHIGALVYCMVADTA